MAKRKRYPAWGVRWENSKWVTDDTGACWERWYKRRAVATSKAAARTIPRCQTCQQRNIRIRPLDYADKDGS